ncbi:uncharacterized protein LOC127699443 isoform X7 [Mytilus californianus]|uniref:uncharacterized protein LOC127699443 isoform X7 n=1 Tax=Mytilus californianus TaxID=6549 RepID=UPI0022484458|nr:uncharacterized protein LOC127699443 isoform X7 [Mytilus californianus]
MKPQRSWTTLDDGALTEDRVNLKDSMFLKLPTNSQLLNRLYANSGVRVRMQVGRNPRRKIPTVRELIEQLQHKHEQRLQKEMTEMVPIKDRSSSTPTVPYSTTDILYGNEVRNSPQLDEIRQNSFIEYSKDKDRLSSNNLVDFNNRRPASKSGTRKSLSIEKVNFNKESDDNLRPILPSPGKNGNQYRPNGLRNGLLKGDPLYGSRGVVVPYYGRESDDLIAMGTIWSPNTGAQKNSGSNSANGIQNVTGKSVSMVASNSSTTVARKNVKPIMVQNSSSHGRSNFKEVEPRYTDPVIGAQPSFQQRLMELSALESETIRYEKSKKVKKKVRDRDS